jgi:hypothetical protein
VRWTRTVSAILAGEESAVFPSIPGVRRPALRWATCRTLTSVLLRATFCSWAGQLTASHSSPPSGPFTVSGI